MATAKAGLRWSYHLTIAVFQVSRAAGLACVTTSFLAPEIRTQISHYTRDKGFFLYPPLRRRFSRSARNGFRANSRPILFNGIPGPDRALVFKLFGSRQSSSRAVSRRSISSNVL